MFICYAQKKERTRKKHSIVMCLMMLMQKKAQPIIFLLYLFETLPSFTTMESINNFAFCKHLSGMK